MIQHILKVTCLNILPSSVEHVNIYYNSRTYIQCIKVYYLLKKVVRILPAYVLRDDKSPMQIS